MPEITCHLATSLRIFWNKIAHPEISTLQNVCSKPSKQSWVCQQLQGIYLSKLFFRRVKKQHLSNLFKRKQNSWNTKGTPSSIFWQKNPAQSLSTTKGSQSLRVLPKLKFFNTFNFFWAWSVCKAFFQRLWNSPALKRTKKEMFQKGVNHLWFASLYMCICQSKCCREKTQIVQIMCGSPAFTFVFTFCTRKLLQYIKTNPGLINHFCFPPFTCILEKYATKTTQHRA